MTFKITHWVKYSKQSQYANVKSEVLFNEIQMSNVVNPTENTSFSAKTIGVSGVSIQHKWKYKKFHLNKIHLLLVMSE